jgi:hypothetical protein
MMICGHEHYQLHQAEHIPPYEAQLQCNDLARADIMYLLKKNGVMLP